MKIIKNIVALLIILLNFHIEAQQTMTISQSELMNKIKGGWAGQTIGVTYGAPIEFRYMGTMMNDYQEIKWYDGLLKKVMTEEPGVYDDLYLDITFVEVFDKEDLDAPASSHANAVANAGYMLWHANQAARYNILNGIVPPASGHWLNNPHADCIDFQIESDFAGLMSLSMPNTATDICDRIGHIMNYGDGWYGGVYVAAMYTLAFSSNDINYIVEEALKTIPEGTKYHECISDVIRWHKQYPDDWKSTWFKIQKKWTDDIGCPDGVYSQFNIDATVNSAYVVMGLLYGKADFATTIEISTRAGQDADCNPSTAGGILGVMLGYDKIPEFWKMGLSDIEDMNFKYTSTSLNKVYNLSYKQALENILKNGGQVNGNMITIKKQIPKPAHWEQSFQDTYPFDKLKIGEELKNEYSIDFFGNGFVIKGQYRPKTGNAFDETLTNVAEVEMYIDGIKTELIKLPMNFTGRRHEIAWKYELESSTHNVKLKLLNPDPDSVCMLYDIILYDKKRRK